WRCPNCRTQEWRRADRLKFSPKEAHGKETLKMMAERGNRVNAQERELLTKKAAQEHKIGAYGRTRRKAGEPGTLLGPEVGDARGVSGPAYGRRRDGPGRARRILHGAALLPGAGAAERIFAGDSWRWSGERGDFSQPGSRATLHGPADAPLERCWGRAALGGFLFAPATGGWAGKNIRELLGDWISAGSGYAQGVV